MTSLLRYEWRRITTVRATWVVIILAAIFTGLQALLISLSEGMAVDDQGVPVEPEKVAFGALLGSTASSFLTVVVLSVIAAMAFGHEYRYGTIRLTLSEFPRRIPVVIAKWLVAMGFILAGWLLSVVVTAVMVLVLPKAYQFGGEGDLGLIMLRSVGFVLGYSTIVFAVTLLTRNMPVGIIVPLLWAAIGEQLVLSVLGTRFEWLPRALPMSAGSGLAGGVDGWWISGLVFAAWCIGLLLLATALFERRDA